MTLAMSAERRKRATVQRRPEWPPGARNVARTLTKLFDALCARPYGMTMREIVDAVYGDDPEGGPEWAVSSIQVTICNFNKRAVKERLGLRIWSRNGNGTIGNGHRHYIFIVREPR